MSNRSLGDAFARLLASLACMVGGIVLSIAVLIYGWGLSPQSWHWIVWGAIGQLFIYLIAVALRG